MPGRGSRPAEKCLNFMLYHSWKPFKKSAGADFSVGYPPPRRRDWPGIHMLNFTYEDAIKIKTKHDAGITWIFFIYP
jgi:hypothetical protein